MQLPIPFRSAGKVWIEVEAGQFTGGVLADARKAVDSGDMYASLLALLVGGTTSMGSDDGSRETDRQRIRAVCREMPWLDAESVVIQAFLLSGVADEIEGAYTCPRCGSQMICEGETADKISELPVAGADLDSKITVELETPVVIKNAMNEEVVVDVREVTLRRATMADCMKAFQRVGINDVARFQFHVYGETVETVSGAAVDQKWRNAWGKVIFERMNIRDLNAITAEERKAGVQTEVRKLCSRCGKDWEIEIQPMSFFASGLRKR